MDLDEQICLTESDKKKFLSGSWTIEYMILLYFFRNETNFEVIITTVLKYDGRGSCKNISLFNYYQ